MTKVPVFPGQHLRAIRLKMKVPVWSNSCMIRKQDHPTQREMAALINYAMGKRGIKDYRISRRSYQNWETRGYSLWMRLSMDSLWVIVNEVIANSHKYEYLRRGEYEKCPTIRPVISERWKDVELDPECCKG